MNGDAGWLVLLIEIGRGFLKAGQRLVNYVQCEFRRQAQQHEAVATFLSRFTPHAQGFSTLLASYPGQDGKAVKTDENAASELGVNLGYYLDVNVNNVKLIQDPRLLHSELKTTPHNVGLFGGPSANPACQAVLGFVGPARNELSVDKKNPLWEKGVLQYYSISNFREKSSTSAIEEFEQSRNSRISGLVWGIASIGVKAPLIRKTDREWTLLIIRLPNLFHEDGKEPVPTLGLIIVDGVHGPATEAFKLLFSPDYSKLLETINREIADSTVFQVPLIVQMKGNEVRGIRYDKVKCPIHSVCSVDQSIRIAAHQYVLNRMEGLFGVRNSK